MSYKSSSIASTLRQINSTLFLPAIQRPYVWKQSEIIELFDSLMQGYPISSFLFWDIEPVNRRKWAIYSFQPQYFQGDSWNDNIEPDGRDITFVLDGQQRLTSLLIGYQGSYTVREKYGRKEKSTSYRAHHLYIDLFKDPDEIDDDEEITANRYAFKFSDIQPRNNHQHLWMKVGDVLDLEQVDNLENYRDKLFADVPERVTASQLVIAEKNLNRLHTLTWLDEPISYFTERVQDMDRVLAIFIRANEGGIKLSKSDLMMAVIETSWGENYVRNEILGLVNRLNRKCGREFKFDKDLIMRACLVIPDLNNIYNVSNFTAHNMAIIQQSWPVIRKSLESTVALLASFGLDGQQLTSVNAIIPIAYYLSKIDCIALDGSSQFEMANREKVRRWLFSALFNGTFGGNSDQTIGVCRDVIRESVRSSRDFPLDRLVETLRTRRARYLAFDEEGVQKLLHLQYGQRYCDLALAMLYGRNHSGSAWHVDHIIPLAQLSEASLRAQGIPGAKIEAIRLAANSFGNLQLLVDRDNLSKSDKEFSAWLKTRDDQFLFRNLIPTDSELWAPEMLLEFIEAREALIRNELKRFLTIV